MQRERRNKFLTQEEHQNLGKRLSEFEKETLKKSDYYKKPEMRLVDDINFLHNQNFFEDIIPRIISDVEKNEGKARIINIMDIGCGLGFFNDQIRAAFGKKVNVYGTTLMRKKSQEKRKKWVQNNPRIYGSFSTEMNPKDGKLQSILEMQNFPEFDLMIDTWGELFWAGAEIQNPQEQDAISKKLFDACCQKLKPGGELYIYSLLKTRRTWLIEHVNELKEEFGVTISIDDKSSDTTHFILKRLLPEQKNAYGT